MSNVSVSITANASGFTAGMGQVSSSARGAAGAVTASLGKATAQVDALSATSRRLVSAQRSAADAAGQVRVAETRLAEVRAKSGSSATAQVRAEEQLAKSKRKLVTAEQQVAQASQVTSRRSQITSRVRQQAADAEIAAAEKVRIANKKAGKTPIFTEKNQTALSQAGSGLTRYGVVGAAAFGLVAKAAIDWQSDFTGVTKTVNDNAAGYAQLEGDLRGLARTLPETHTQIAATAEAAGQLGVSRSGLVPFVKTMIELGDTTNLSSDEAATSIAQLMNITGAAPSTVTALGDSLVKLGNNGASTEKDILDLGLRIAGAGHSVGLTQTQILGFASAVASTGIQVEAGGTAMSQNFVAIDKAVRQGGKSLGIYAKTSGETSAQFAKEWGSDPASATTKFVEGLARIKKSGGSIQSTLDQLGIKGQRQQDVYVRLAGATKIAGAQTDLLRQSLIDAGNAQGALGQEAAKRYQTDASKIKVALNNITDAAITAGGAVLPVISDLAGDVAHAARSFQQLPKGLQSFAVQGGAVASVGLLVGGALLSAAGNAVALGNGLKGLADTSPRVASGLATIKAAAGPVLVTLLALEAAGKLSDTFGSQRGSFDDTSRALSNYATAAQKGQQASLDLTSAFPKPNVVDGVAAAIFATVPKVDSLNKALVLTTQHGFAGFLTGAEGLLEKLKPGQQSMEAAAAGINQIDTSLSNLVTNGHADQAATAFQKIAAENKDIAPADLISKFGTYAKSLQQVADAAGVTSLSQDDLYGWMNGKIPAAVTKAAAASPAFKKQLDAITSSSKAVPPTLDQILTSLYAFPNAMLATSSAAGQLGGAFDAAQKAVGAKGFKKGLDQATASGRQNQQSLDALAAAANNNSAAMIKAGASQKAIGAAVGRSRGEYAKVAREMGVGSKAAKVLAGDLIPLGKAHNVRIVTSGAKVSTDQAIILNHELKKLPPKTQAKIVTIAENKGAKAAQHAIDELAKKKTGHVKVTTDTKGVDSAKKKVDDVAKGKHTAKVDVDLNKNGVADALDHLPKPKPIKVPVSYTGKGENSAGSGKPKPVVIPVKYAQPKALAGVKGKDIVYQAKVTPPKTPTVKGKTVTYGSKVTPPKTPAVPKGKTVTYPSKVTAPKIPKIAAPKPLKITSTFDGGGVSKAKSAIGGVKPKSVKVTVTTSGTAGVRAAVSAIAAVHSKSAAVTITTTHRNVTETIKRAGGGKLYGPGTETSDSIPVMGSKNEWVIQASSANKYGDSVMGAINAGAIPKAAFSAYGYATGGKLGYHAQGFAKGGKVKDPAPIVVGPIDYSEIAKLVATNPSAFADIQSAMKDIAKATAKGKKGLDDLKSATDALKSAQQSLADTVKQQAQSLAEPYQSKSHDIDDWLESLREGAKDLTTFQGEISQLKALGISDTVLKSITDQGAVVGSELAEQLIAGGKTYVSALNKATDNVATAANAVALNVTGVKVETVKGHAYGGWVGGVGSSRSDSNLIAASRGEFVVPTEAARKHGQWLEAITYGRNVVDRGFIDPRLTGFGGSSSHLDQSYHAGDVVLRGDFGGIDNALRKARYAQQDAQTMYNLTVGSI